jgi:hypothetical protein
MRKPDAGNLHVRFDEGEGPQRSLAFEAFHPVRPLSTLLVNAFLAASGAQPNRGRTPVSIKTLDPAEGFDYRAGGAH